MKELKKATALWLIIVGGLLMVGTLFFLTCNANAAQPFFEGDNGTVTVGYYHLDKHPPLFNSMCFYDVQPLPLGGLILEMRAPAFLPGLSRVKSSEGFCIRRKSILKWRYHWPYADNEGFDEYITYYKTEVTPPVRGQTIFLVPNYHQIGDFLFSLLPIREERMEYDENHTIFPKTYPYWRRGT